MVVEKTTGQVIEKIGERFEREDTMNSASVHRGLAAGRPDQRSEFKIVGLPAGRYLAAAVDYLPPGDEHDPDLLNRLEAIATRLTLVDGETATVSLKTVASEPH